MPSVARRLIRNFGLVALFLGAALLGIASGVIFAFIGDLPQISALDDYSAGTITRVLGRDGTVIGEFAKERRELVTYEQIPVVFRNALISAEDRTFFSHSGFNISRIAVAFFQNIRHMRIVGGASTITQQLAKKLFLTDDQTPERKIKEALLTLQIEKRYTKEEIFTLYCNQMYFGHQTYGVEAASKLYFAKHVGELSLDEAAMIAGIVQGNDRQSPYRNMKAATDRRNIVLDRMATNGYVTKADAEAAKKRPIVTRGEPARTRSIAPHFVENIRIHLEEVYGEKALYESGLTVKTGIDPVLQKVANRALDTRIRELDHLRGYRKPAHNLVAENKPLDTYRDTRWNRDPVVEDILPAVVSSTEGGLIHARVGKWTATIDREGFKWTGRTVDNVVHRGDVIELRVKKLDSKTLTMTADYEQTPEIEGAVIAIDNHTGQIMAMVGGRSFERSQFNRATQAMRQVGSLFKPFVYTTAINLGYTTTDTLHDEPTSFPTGPGQPPYEPKNFDGNFEHDIPIRRALEDSRNVPTIALMNELGPPAVIATARKMGITTPIPEYLSVAIGAAEGTLLEMVSAYTAFPNQGVRMSPIFGLEVTDREGNVIEQARPESHDAIRADTAYVMTNLLQGVVQHGTAIQVMGDKDLAGWPLGGKTGTTDDATDAWFIGFDPDITVGVWVGYDQKRSLGSRAQGANTALPMWEDIMKSWVVRQRQALPRPPIFDRPGNVTFVMTPTGSLEPFIAGTTKGKEK